MRLQQRSSSSSGKQRGCQLLVECRLLIGRSLCARQRAGTAELSRLCCNQNDSVGATSASSILLPAG